MPETKPSTVATGRHGHPIEMEMMNGELLLENSEKEQFMSYELMQKIAVISDAWGFGDKTDAEALSEIKQIFSEAAELSNRATQKLTRIMSNENQNAATETSICEVSTSDLLEAISWMRTASDSLTKAFCWKNPEDLVEEDMARLGMEICGQRWTGVRGIIEKLTEAAENLERAISSNAEADPRRNEDPK